MRQVSPVQSYFLDTPVPGELVKYEVKELDVQHVSSISKDEPPAAGTTATGIAKEQQDNNDQKKG